MHECRPGHGFLVPLGSPSHLHRWFGSGSRRQASQCASTTKLGSISNMPGNRQNQNEAGLGDPEKGRGQRDGPVRR